jgi:hypothetical protein
MADSGHGLSSITSITDFVGWAVIMFENVQCKPTLYVYEGMSLVFSNNVKEIH